MFEEAPQIAEALGCTGSDMKVAQNVAPSKFAAQTVRCNARGDIGYVTVDYFEDTEYRDKHVDLGVSRGQLFVVGEPWTVNVDTGKQLRAVMKIVGGKATIDESGEVVIP